MKLISCEINTRDTHTIVVQGLYHEAAFSPSL